MSKPYALLIDSDGLVMVDRYEDAKSLRAALKEVPPGTYHAMRFISNGEGIVVSDVTERKVTMGDGPEPKKRSASEE